MLFNSYLFILVFLPLVLLGYYGLNYAKCNQLAQVYLIAMSLWFYGYQNIYYLAILVVSVLLNYLISRGLFRFQTKNMRILFLWAGIAINLGILFYFKYYDFFLENINSLFHTDYPLLGIILPLGVSFYTFQQLSYIIDCYKNECEEYTLIEYATYVTFFPQLIAGPIVYHTELIPQFRKTENRKLDAVHLSKGVYAFSLGLAKKVLIADTLSRFVTIGYGQVEELNAISALFVMLCYSLQIYFDFSGYCDMAYGIGYLFHVKLPINFHSPYKAVSVADFWDRWHMTLTRFFTKYVYIPLGGNRKGVARTYCNVMVVFLISGIWHGAAWNFVLWGILHGVWMLLHRMIGKYFEGIPKVLRRLGTFSIVTALWSLFRASSIEQAKQLWSCFSKGGWTTLCSPLVETFQDLTEIKALNRIGLAMAMEHHSLVVMFVFVLLIFVACMILRNTQEKVETMCFKNRTIVVVVVLLLWSVTSLTDVSEFLYFNF